jgi:hypothetical protein
VKGGRDSVRQSLRQLRHRFLHPPNGLFLTNEQIVLVLNPSLDGQRVLKAKVVRTDKVLDLAGIRFDREAVGSGEPGSGRWATEVLLAGKREDCDCEADKGKRRRVLPLCLCSFPTFG